MGNNMLFLYRRRSGMRQLDLARKLGISEQTISGYETGRVEVTIERAVDIARIIHADPKEVFPTLFK